MKLTSDQIMFFNVFGFLVLKQLFSSQEMNTITNAFSDVMQRERAGHEFTGDQRQAVFGCVEMHPELMSLIDENRIYDPIEQLLGPDFLYWSSDGNLYVGDTSWHPDAHEGDFNYSRIKIAFYLDHVSKDTGCLRVIPGSHQSQFHTELYPLKLWRMMQLVNEDRMDETELKPFLDLGLEPDRPVFGTDQWNLPSFSLESEPGDMVIFSHYLFHGSWGGKTGRRMFTLNYMANPINEGQVEMLNKLYKNHVRQQAISFTKRRHKHQESFMECDRPRIRRITSRLKKLGFI